MQCSGARRVPRFRSARHRNPLKTVEEIQALVTRSELQGRQVRDAWEALYLSLPQIAGLLQLVRERARELLVDYVLPWS